MADNGPTGGQPGSRLGMDVLLEQKKNRKKYIYAAIGLLALVAATVALARLKPAAPSVDRATIWTDTVKRGEMVRQVRGPGTLVPEHIRYISAVTAGRVEKRLVDAGARVEPGTELMDLENPDVRLQLLEAEQQLAAAQASLVETRTNLNNQRLNQEGTVATVQAQYNDAMRQARANEELAKKQVISGFELEKSREAAQELSTRIDVEKKRLDLMTRNIGEQISVQESQIERLKSIVAFQRDRLNSLVVRSPDRGVVQELNFEPGQWVQAGQELARVVQPEKLKAVLRIPEVQAKDVSLGQSAQIDTRNGIIPGHVMRIDPAATGGTVTVDVALDVDSLPPGARPDLSVDGTIEVERLNDVLHVGRPAYGQANSSVGLFKLVSNNEAERVTVQLGASSVNDIEIKSGLKEGDIVILSDMSAWDAHDRVRLK
ncbi:MAG TPA: HlyD family efflux transporter periplasmic adaptor subunit [Longimicrobiales bacterium]|nr:HlyD family efflux transporter periplasmic adaptor subunit [Longimicrobiales bacterium]